MRSYHVMDIDWTHLSSESVTRPGIPLGVRMHQRRERDCAMRMLSSVATDRTRWRERERVRERDRQTGETVFAWSPTKTLPVLLISVWEEAPDNLRRV